MQDSPIGTNENDQSGSKNGILKCGDNLDDLHSPFGFI